MLSGRSTIWATSPRWNRYLSPDSYKHFKHHSSTPWQLNSPQTHNSPLVNLAYTDLKSVLGYYTHISVSTSIRTSHSYIMYTPLIDPCGSMHRNKYISIWTHTYHSTTHCSYVFVWFTRRFMSTIPVISSFTVWGFKHGKSRSRIHSWQLDSHSSITTRIVVCRLWVKQLRLQHVYMHSTNCCWPSCSPTSTFISPRLYQIRREITWNYEVHPRPSYD